MSCAGYTKYTKITANPLHPFAKFSVGNATTLADLPDLPVRQRLFDYWQTYYTAANAALVLIGPQSIAELTALAQVFASLPRSRLPEPMPEQPIYLPEQLGCKIFVRAIERRQPTDRHVFHFRKLIATTCIKPPRLLPIFLATKVAVVYMPPAPK